MTQVVWQAVKSERREFNSGLEPLGRRLGTPRQGKFDRYIDSAITWLGTLLTERNDAGGTGELLAMAVISEPAKDPSSVSTAQ